MIPDARKKEFKAQLRAAEKQKLLDSLPLDLSLLKALFISLENDQTAFCDNTLRATTQFLVSQKIDPVTVIPWLHAHGGYCDCEVLANVYNAVGDLIDWPLENDN